MPEEPEEFPAQLRRCNGPAPACLEVHRTRLPGGRAQGARARLWAPSLSGDSRYPRPPLGIRCPRPGLRPSCLRIPLERWSPSERTRTNADEQRPGVPAPPGSQRADQETAGVGVLPSLPGPVRWAGFAVCIELTGLPAPPGGTTPWPTGCYSAPIPGPGPAFLQVRTEPELSTRGRDTGLTAGGLPSTPPPHTLGVPEAGQAEGSRQRRAGHAWPQPRPEPQRPS